LRWSGNGTLCAAGRPSGLAVHSIRRGRPTRMIVFLYEEGSRQSGAQALSLFFGYLPSATVIDALGLKGEETYKGTALSMPFQTCCAGFAYAPFERIQILKWVRRRFAMRGTRGACADRLGRRKRPGNDAQTCR